jgi:hypothetical protein
VFAGDLIGPVAKQGAFGRVGVPDNALLIDLVASDRGILEQCAKTFFTFAELTLVLGHARRSALQPGSKVARLPRLGNEGHRGQTFAKQPGVGFQRAHLPGEGSS